MQTLGRLAVNLALIWNQLRISHASEKTEGILKKKKKKYVLQVPSEPTVKAAAEIMYFSLGSK